MKKLILILSVAFFISSTMNANNGSSVLTLKKIETNLQKFNKQKDLYKWEVESNYGKASGTCLTLEKAKEMIALVGKEDITTYKIIVSR